MKKRLLILFTVISLSAMPLAAVEYGVVLGAGLDSSFVHIYPYESAAFKTSFNDIFSVDVGIRVLDNFSKDTNAPLFFFMPTINFTIWHFYIGGGLCMSGKTQYDYDVIFQLRTGSTFGNWKWGEGYGGMDVGIEISPTIVTVSQDEDTTAAGAAIGSVILSMFNMLKLNIGVTWYIPFD